MKRKLSLLLFALFPMVLTACGAINIEPQDDFGVTGVVITSAKELFLTRGQHDTITADVLVKDESVDKTLIWRSSDSNIASVDQNGLVVAGSTVGECYVSAISAVSGHADRCTVYVGGGSVDVTAITLSQTSVVFEKDDVTPVEVIPTVEPSAFTINMIKWTNSDDTVAKMEKTEKGIKITPIKEGKTTIVATAGSKTATCNVTVKGDAPIVDPTITLKVHEKTIKKGETFALLAETSNIPDQRNLTFTVSDETVAKVLGRTGRQITVQGENAGEITIKAEYIVDEEVLAEDECKVTVTNETDNYMDWCATWSKPGHVYLHYLRLSDTNYDPWAVWFWQKVPEDSEGTFWGATQSEELAKVDISTVTQSWMTSAEVKKGGSEVYLDTNGQIVDIDVSRTDLLGGKTHTPTSFKDVNGNYCDRCGFLIVDQASCQGKSHWKSDGGIEAYVKGFSDLVNDTDKYCHIFCIEGQVTNFTTSDGQEIDPNPTIEDHTGQYRSHNDITNLLRDDHSGKSTPTSTSFLNDRPGVGYQIFVPAFADSDGDGLGDLGGIIAKLNDNYFKDLGVGVLWLTPVQESGSYHGYDVTDYYAIDSKFGTMDQYKQMIQIAHSQGIKVVMDMVINHTSKNNVLFQASQKAGTISIAGKEYNARDMYLWKFKGDKVREWDGNEVAQGVAAKYNNVAVENAEDWYQFGSSDYYYFGKFGSGMAELNYSCEATRLYMEEMCKWWLKETGLDGFRLDAIKHIYLESELSPEDANKYARDDKVYDVSYRTYYDDEMKETVTAKNDYSYDRDLNVKFWKEFAWNIKSAYPNCFFVGENFDGWNERMAPFYEAIDSQFDFSTYYHLNETPTGAIGTDLKTSLEIYSKARKSSQMINGAYTSNHDIARMMNHAVAATFIPNNSPHHAEINNSNYQKAVNQAKFNAAFTILAPGVSWIYYGDEIGLTGNTNDKVPGEIDDHGNNVDRWYRQPMKWTNALGTSDGSVYTTNYTFGGLHIAWDSINSSKTQTVSQQEADKNSMLNYFQALGKVKADPKYPTYGKINWAGTIIGETNSCSMQIDDGQRKVNVFINNSDVALDIPEANRTGKMLGCSEGGTLTKVPAHGFVVLYY